MPIKLLEVSDGTIDRMLRSPRFIEAFPFLETAAKQISDAVASGKLSKCGGCAARRRKALGINYDDIKRTMVSLPADRKKVLCEMLDAKQLRIRWRKTDGKLAIQTIG